VTGVEAVVLAAGEGRRLRPLTERYAKPVLPIDGEPVLATLLHELASAGVERAWVVTGHLAEQVEALAGDGSAFGLEVRTVRQPRPDGSADAVRRALAAGASPPLVASAADTCFAAGDIARFLDAAAAADGALAVRRDPPPPPGATVDVAAGQVVHVLGGARASPFGGAPLWAFGPAAAAFLDDLPGPPYELAVALQRAVDAGLAIAAPEIGPTRDITTPFDVLEHNFPYLRRLRS
jgi:CTP:molybdopterin cytidylyltransferase MocA